MKTNTCEHGGDHPAPKGKRFCSDACTTCERTEFDSSKGDCAGLCKPPPKSLDWQERVKEERAELDQKLARLREFRAGKVFEGLPAAEAARLRYQELLMREYSRVLSERIAA